MLSLMFLVNQVVSNEYSLCAYFCKIKCKEFTWLF
jgi:hypothetical protein